MSSGTPVRVRKDVYTLGQPGDDLDWYGQAVGWLRQRPLTEVTGWRFMAAVHGYPRNSPDPFAIPGESLPPTAVRKRFWNQCQHRTWFFLPWHRGYLACFEEIVADVVVNKLGGPPGWALPYWDYSEPEQAGKSTRALPPAFLSPNLPDGTPNPLWVDGRDMTTPQDEVDPAKVSLGALRTSPFSKPVGGADTGFGGPPTGFHHSGGTSGTLEHLPHDLVHDAIGGIMGDPDTAALDPVFWLHHANIDRLWEVWTQRDPSFTNPPQAAWLQPTPFELHDAQGTVVAFTPDQMQDTTQVRHGYRYDNIADPLKPPVAAQGVTMTVVVQLPPELVATSQGSVVLGGTPTSARVAFNQASKQSAVQRLAASQPVRAYLNLENVTGDGVYGSYRVYINAPSQAATASKTKPLLAGHLSTFGVKQASSQDDPHGGSGITTVLEITQLVQQLQTERKWDGVHLDVSFEPERPAVALRGVERGPLKVGRISVYYG